MTVYRGRDRRSRFLRCFRQPESRTLTICTAEVTSKHEYFRQYGGYFLGHAPKTDTEKSYGAESDQPFFRALRFIRNQLGYE